MERRDFDVDFDGARLVCARFETAPDLPPLLLLPGTMGHVGAVLPLISELAKRFSVLTFDQPGTNDVPPPPFATPERLAHIVGALCVREFRGAPATLYGISLGAVVAGLIARARPSRVRAVIMDDPIFSPEDWPGIANYAASALSRLPAEHPIVRAFCAFTGFDPGTGGADGRDYRHLWPEISAPILVLAGDGFAARDEAAARTAPGLRAIERHPGHPVWMADPADFAARTAGFAARAPAPPSRDWVEEDEYAVRLTDGTIAICPRAPTSTSTIILLEKEVWFEDEFAFVRSLARPGWRAVDGGANLGVYTLTLARAGAEVLAFEPNPPIADRGTRAIALNGLSERVHHRQAALGAVAGTARFDRSGPSENARLAADGAIDVPVVTLDAELERLEWPALDFLKLDLEGGEADALRGARRSLARYAPLVMTEIVNADTTRNWAPLRELVDQGHAIYKLLPGADALVPFDFEAPEIDAFLAYGFGVKPERARALAAAGRLVETLPPPEPLDDPAPLLALALSRVSAFARNPEFVRRMGPPRESAAREYAEAIARFERARLTDRPLPLRVADLLEAERLANAAHSARPGLARTLTYARIARAAGRRGGMIDVLGKTLDLILAGTKLAPDEPLIPAVERYETVADDAGKWITACLIEGFVLNASFAAGFNPNAFSGTFWDFLENAGFAMPEMLRARQIQAMALGAQSRPMPHPALARFRPDNLNPEIWRGL